MHPMSLTHAAHVRRTRTSRRSRRTRQPRHVVGNFALALLALFAAPDRAAAQATGGSIDVVAIAAEDGAPIAFALVRLLAVSASDTAAALPGTTVAEPLRRGVTSAAGHLRFADLPAGEYRVQLVRIGYRPVYSPVLRAVPGETLRHELRALTQVVELPAVTVRAPGGDCIGMAQIGGYPRLAADWREARQGVELRRAFERQYRFVTVLRQEGTVRYRLRGARPMYRLDTLVSEPDSAEARQRRRVARLREEGLVQGGMFTIPSEKDLLDEEFVRDYCLEPPNEETAGMVGLGFRPRSGQRDVATVRGTLWLDAHTYLARRLDVVWVKGGETLAEGSIDYADVPVTGTTLRLPTGGRMTARRFLGPSRLLASGGSVAVTQTYGDFVLVRGK